MCKSIDEKVHSILGSFAVNTAHEAYKKAIDVDGFYFFLLKTLSINTAIERKNER